LGRNIIFLSNTDQVNLNNDFVNALPWRSFARKNVGYLYAIARGAKTIWDFDDDNILKFWMEGASVDPFLDIETFADVSGEHFSLFFYIKFSLKIKFLFASGREGI